MTTYVDPPLRGRFDAWLAGSVARHSPPLELPEIRKGVRALSSLWVERRSAGRLAARAVEGAGKRAALATYYAPLHFLTLHHALRPIEATHAVRRVFDLGCGTGATGAAVATWLSDPPEVRANDLSGWALAEAEHTYAAFGLLARTRRTRLPGAVPRAREGDLIALGWVVNELDDDARAALLPRLRSALRAGAALLIAEPLSGRASPWWSEWCHALEPLGATDERFRAEVDRPEWIEALDHASRLDHRELGARLLRAL